VGIRCADHVTPLYPQKLALTSPTSGGRSVGIVRSRAKDTEFSLGLNLYIVSVSGKLYMSLYDMIIMTCSTSHCLETVLGIYGMNMYVYILIHNLDLLILSLHTDLMSLFYFFVCYLLLTYLDVHEKN
jgi:hypothetical protein